MNGKCMMAYSIYPVPRRVTCTCLLGPLGDACFAKMRAAHVLSKPTSLSTAKMDHVFKRLHLRRTESVRRLKPADTMDGSPLPSDKATNRLATDQIMSSSPSTPRSRKRTNHEMYLPSDAAHRSPFPRSERPSTAPEQSAGRPFPTTDSTLPPKLLPNLDLDHNQPHPEPVKPSTTTQPTTMQLTADEYTAMRATQDQEQEEENFEIVPKPTDEVDLDAQTQPAQSSKPANATLEPESTVEAPQPQFPTDVNSFVQMMQQYQANLDAEYEEYVKELAERDQDEDIEDYDWDDLEARYFAEMEAKVIEEKQITDECHKLLDVRLSPRRPSLTNPTQHYLIWVKSASQRETDRALGR